MKKRSRKIFIILPVTIVLLIIITVFSLNNYVVNSTKNSIISLKDASDLSDVDCVLVLGAGVRNGKPTAMLRDRILTGISLYEQKSAPKLLMSGDHGTDNYDEVNIMKSYAVQRGVIDSDVFMDHAGFSTYDSVYRAKRIFEADKIIIVSQKYHLYRALYVAKKLGIEAYGVSADLKTYRGQTKRDIREIIARDKDCIKCILKPEPTYLGQAIPVSGDGNKTND